jgi:hypothetical protein
MKLLSCHGGDGSYNEQADGNEKGWLIIMTGWFVGERGIKQEKRRRGAG